MRKLTITAFAFAAALIGVAQPSYAYHVRQGVQYNSFTLNGINLNGINLNGIIMNGVKFNANTLNDGGVDTIPLLTIDQLTLADGTSVVLQY